MGDYPGLSRWALSVDAEEHLTTEERWCDDKSRSFEQRKKAQAKDYRQTLETEKDKEMDSLLTISRFRNQSCLWPNKTDFELLIFRTTREYIWVVLNPLSLWYFVTVASGNQYTQK